MKLIYKLTGQAKFILAIAGASVLGGLTSAVVLAAIPDSNGVIHGCYTNITAS